MKELDDELWKLGIPAKTKHNEVAPAQHELAPIFTIANRAIDHNLVTMELMKTVASHHGLVCLQHEKPFDGVNGSGKHNNWSMATDTGSTCSTPARPPSDNLRFLVFLTAIIEAVDDYQELLRMLRRQRRQRPSSGRQRGAAGHHLHLPGRRARRAWWRASSTAKSTRTPQEAYVDLGVDGTPQLPARTTPTATAPRPFAFTGNKFEFRMPGSQVNLSDANTVLNTAVAKALKDFTQAVDGAENFEQAAFAWVRSTLTAHQRIIFNGDGYSDEWLDEAERRGLLNLKSTVDAAPTMVDQKNLDLFEEFNVMSPVEVKSRYEVKLEQYSKLLNIEGRTMSHMTKRKIAPAVSTYADQVASTIIDKKAACPDIDPAGDTKLLRELNDGSNRMATATAKLDAALEKAQGTTDVLAQARSFHDDVLTAMDELREICDEMENIVSTEAWPLPTYNKMLFYC